MTPHLLLARLQHGLSCTLLALGALAPVSLAHAKVGSGEAMSLPPAPLSALHAPMLRGAGDYRWFGWKLYEARLWTEQAAATAPPLEGPLVLELSYARAISGARIADASRDEMARLGFGTPQSRAIWHARMRALFPDVQEGTRLAGVHLPAQGALFYRDDVLIGRVDDPAFAQAFFSIWLDARSAAPALRAALLGQQDGERR